MGASLSVFSHRKLSNRVLTQTLKASSTRTFSLFHFVLGGVAFAGENRVLDVLVLLVLDDKRLVVGADQFHPQLAIGAVLLGIGRLVGDGVFIADGAGDLTKDVRKLAE